MSDTFAYVRGKALHPARCHCFLCSGNRVYEKLHTNVITIKCMTYSSHKICKPHLIKNLLAGTYYQAVHVAFYEIAIDSCPIESLYENNHRIKKLQNC